MNKTKNALYGNKVLRKVISWCMVLAMVFGLTPADFSLVAKAATATVKVYFEKPDSWTTPVIHVWNDSADIDGDGKAEITTWGQEKAKLYLEETTGLYYAVVTNPNWTGFQFVNAETAAEHKIDDAAVLKAFNGLATDSSVYYLADDAGDYAWYTDAEGKNLLPLETIELKDDYFVVGGIVSTGWDEKATTSQLTKNDDGTYSITLTAVKAGTYEFKVLQDPVNFAWKYAWGGDGPGGNYVLELEKKSDVVISINPKDETYKVSVEVKTGEITPSVPTTPETPTAAATKAPTGVPTEVPTGVPTKTPTGVPTTPETPTEVPTKVPEKPVVMQSPIYNADGTVTFNVATTGEAAIVKGIFSSWEAIPMEAVEGGFTKTVEITTDGGLYDYGMEVDGEWVGDPANKIQKGNPVVVRNPEIGNGTVTIYVPYEGALDGKVLYRKAGTTEEYKEAAATAVEGGTNLYAAVIADAEANVEYEYVIKAGDAEAVADTYNYVSTKVVDGVKVTTFTAKAAVIEPEHTSPVINADKTVTFNYFSPTAKEVYLAGGMNGWDPKGTAMVKDEKTGLFTVTQTLTAGNHEYKFVVDGNWITDPKNEKTANGNSVVTVPASEEGVQSPIVDEENATITFNFDPADYGLEDIEGVNLMGTVPGTDWNTGLPMELTEEGYFTVTVKDILAGRYQYKFKTSGGTWLTDAKNAEQESGNSLVIMPGMMISGGNIAGAGKFQFVADGVADEGSVKFSLAEKKTGFSINKDGLLTVRSYAKTGYFTLRLDYKVDGVDKYSVSKYYYTERAAIYEYEYKEDSKWTGISDIYTWNNAESVTDYKFIEKDGKYTAYINADKETTSFGYIVRLEGKWGADSTTDREFSDRTFTLHDGERYTKVRGGEGIEVPYVCASGKNYYDNGIIFNYRDDNKFYNGTMDTIKEAKVVINDVEYDMEYNEKDELFTFAFQNIPDGDYEYFYVIDGEKVTDQYNPSGKYRYEKPEIGVAVGVTPRQANYDQNPVVEFQVTNKETGEPVELGSIEVDITKIAGKEMSVQFSTITNKGVLYIDRSVKPGTYRLPVILTDCYGNTTHTYVDFEVVDKESTDKSWDEARVYFIVTDRFNDGDASNNGTVGYDTTKAEAYRGGDLAGITEKLGYLQELGINTIWITPIVDNIEDVMNAELTQTAYHGYWAKDFTKLDEHLGTTADLDRLLDEAHKHGIKVMVDIVVNHAGYNTNDSEEFAEMLRKPEELGSDFITYELSGLPDFKTEIQDVRAKLIAWQTAWANHTTANGNRIDYFRVDTVKHVEHETWQQLKTSLAEVNPNFKMIGEFYGASYLNTGEYLGQGQMDSELDFEFKSVAANFVNGQIDAAEENLEKRNAALTNNITLGQFLSSHDEDGFLYTQKYDFAKGKLAASLQMTAKGQPVIYYGEEIGLSGPNTFGAYENNRYDMQFDNLTEEQQGMLTHYKKLLAAREMYSKTFATGSRTKIAGGNEEGYLVFKRGTGEDAVYVALNTTAEAKTVSINLAGTTTPDTPALNATMTDIYSGKEVQVVNNVVEFTIPANTDGGTVILANGKKLSGIEAVTPVKTEYEVGETLDLSNLTVTGIYGDAKIALSCDAYVVDASAVDTTKAGSYEVKVTAGEFTDTFTVVVKAKPTVAPTKAPTATPIQKYTISYVMNKGTNNSSNPTSYTTTDVTLKNPTRKGYTFSGWYIDSSYSAKVTTIKASTKKNVTVYAKWTKVKVSKPTIKSVKNTSSKKAKVTIKKVSGAKGYEIKYSTDKKFKKSVKKVTSKKTTKTITKLKKGKTYYIKARAYKLDSTGKKVYSKYSKVKKVTITK